MVNKKLVYLFYGQEDFLIDEEIERIKRETVDPSFEVFSVEKIEEENCNSSRIINSIQTLPMLGAPRIIIVKFKDFSDDEVDVILKSIKGMGEGITLIFVAVGAIDRRKKFVRCIEEIGSVKEFKPFAEWEQEKLLSWIVEKVKKSQKSIGSHAARLLMEISGSNLRQLSAEIEKIITYIGDRNHIEEKDVKSLANPGEINVFALLNALRNKDIPLALLSLRRLLKEKEEPTNLLGLLSTQYRMLLQVKSLIEEGLSIKEISDRLSANLYFVKKCVEVSHNFTIPELKTYLEHLYVTDLKLKTEFSSKEIFLELLVTDLGLKQKLEVA